MGEEYQDPPLLCPIKAISVKGPLKRIKAPSVMSVLQQGFLKKWNRDGFVMGPEIITTISPSTNKPVLTRNGLSDSDVALLPATSTQAFNSFRLIPLEERRSIVSRALKLISEKQDVLARELTEQMGRPIAYAAIEIKTAVKRGEYLLKISGDALKDTAGEPEQGFKRYIRKAPIGPVLILFAWNVGGFTPKISNECAKTIFFHSIPISSLSTP